MVAAPYKTRLIAFFVMGLFYVLLPICYPRLNFKLLKYKFTMNKLVILICVFITSQAVYADTLTGKVVKITNGETVYH